MHIFPTDIKESDKDTVMSIHSVRTTAPVSSIFQKQPRPCSSSPTVGSVQCLFIVTNIPLGIMISISTVLLYAGKSQKMSESPANICAMRINVREEIKHN